jgi:hypothetical protein
MTPHARFIVLALFASPVTHSLLAQGRAAPPAIPKRLAAPQLDGRCTDPAYETALRLAAGRAPIVLVHSGLALFACVDSLPTAARSVSLWIDPEAGRGEAGRQRRGLSPAQIVVRVWPDGRVVARQGTAAEAGPLADLRAGQFRAAAARGDQFWTSEVAIPLERLGGAGGIAALRVSLDGDPGETVSEWPEPSDESRPSTWGELMVGPPPVALAARSGIRAGSAFTDGRGGYLAIPYFPAAAGPAVTFEAWVRVVDNDCGTLLGAGYEHGYWIGICDVVQYRRPGGSYTRAGRTRLSKGWHHVGLTLDSTGEEALSVDGVVELVVGRRTAGETERDAPRRRVPEQRRPDEAADSTAEPPPPVPLRLGSDAEAPEELDYLHAYISEVRIWSAARTQAELRRAATARLTGREPGLAALWRFADGLTDLAGAGRRAGVVGFASLAAEARDTSVALRPLPRGGPRVASARPQIPAWDGRLPVILDSITVDGICRPDEYEDAAWIPLEPARALVVQAALTERGLYLCTGVLPGRQDRTSTITLYLARDGAVGRLVRGDNDLEITIAGDGSVTILPQDRRTPAPTRDSVRAIVATVVGRAKLDLQPDDVRPLDVAWWSAEVRIPWLALDPFALEGAGRLRFALDYQAPPQPAGGPELRTLARGRWPAELDVQAPATWGAVSVTRETVRAPTTIDFSRRDGFDPNDADYYAACPTDAAHTATYISFPSLKWPLVDPATAYVQVEGTLSRAEMSTEDSPFIHNTHDIDMHVTPRVEDRWLVLNADQGETDLVLETESGRFSARARPLPGDRVIAAGRWIFDCGHDPKTEIHPTPVFVTDRLETRPVRPGKPLQQVRVIRIWLKSKPSVFSYSFSGTLAFAAALPQGYHHFASVVEADLPPAISRFGDSVLISVTPPATGQFYVEIVLGALDPAHTVPDAKAFIVNLDHINVNDDLDAAAPEKSCSSISGGLHDCGEWTLVVNLNGTGKTIWNRKDVSDADNPWTIGIKVPVAGGDLRMHASGYEDDDGNLTKLPNFDGDDIGQSHGGFWSLGSLGGLCCSITRTFNAPGGNWQLKYRVFADAPELNVLPTASHPYWTSRLADELNDGYWFTSLGTLTPSVGLPVTVIREASILEAPLVKDGVRLLGSDEDLYRLTLGDFGTVTAEVLDVPSLPASVEAWYDPWYSALPQSVKDKIGFKGAQIRVAGTGGLGDLEYTLRVRAIYKVLPPDWGEAADATPDGRIVDLVTPDAATEVFPGGQAWGGWPLQPYRRLVKDWAWQHIAGDVDTYTVLFPKVVTGAGLVVFTCKYNQPAALELRAYNERIAVPSLSIDSADLVRMIGLSSKFPEGKARIQIRAGAKGPRGLYRLEATWRDAVYYSPEECETRTEFERKMRERLGTLTALPDEPPFGFSKPKPLPQGLISPELGAGAAYSALPLGDAGAVDLVVSSAAEQPAIARLYDLDGVLLSESVVAGDAEASQVGPWGGLVATAHLVARGLTRNQTYIVQIVPGGLGKGGAALDAAAITARTW